MQDKKQRENEENSEICHLQGMKNMNVSYNSIWLSMQITHDISNFSFNLKTEWDMDDKVCWHKLHQAPTNGGGRLGKNI